MAQMSSKSIIQIQLHGVAMVDTREDIEALQSWDNFFSAVSLFSFDQTSEENFSLDQRTISYATARIENCLIGLQRILDRLHDAATTESMILD